MSNDLLFILMSWCVHLTGYAMPETLPEIVFKPHAFFVEEVCGGRECKVVGLYKDDGVVYLDDRYQDLQDSFTSSLVVHEFVHSLQDKTMDPCLREREAYYVQQRYLTEALARIDLIMPKPCSSLAVLQSHADQRRQTDSTGQTDGGGLTDE